MLGGGEQRKLRRGTYGTSFAGGQTYNASTDFEIF
jgi:hypothetical protein